MRNKFFTTKTLLYPALFAFVGLMGCNPEEDMNPTGELSQEATQMAQGEVSNKVKMYTDRYIMISSTEKLPAGLAKQIADMGGEVAVSVDEIGVAVVTSNDPGFAGKAGKLAGIRSVVRDLEIEWYNQDDFKTYNLSESSTVEATSANTNPYFPLLWGHQAIKAPQAWAAGARGQDVRVAVLDGGFDLTHPDLRPNVDVGASASFVDGEELQFNPNVRGNTFSHGTHVAGTIAAVDNNIGIVGVAPDAELVLVKVLSDKGSGPFSGIIQGIYHAANQNVDVINMSLGAVLPRNGRYLLTDGTIINEARANQELIIALNRATSYANKKGVTVIAAAGNSAIDGNKDQSLIHVPANSTGVISISATAPVGWAADQQGANLDVITTYTNFGTPTVTFAAPGGDDAYPTNEAGIVGPFRAPVWAFDLVFSLTYQDYTWTAGTSMASPHAAGVAALIISKNGGSMDPAHVLAKLRATSDDLGKPGRDPLYGYGRLNAFRAVTE